MDKDCSRSQLICGVAGCIFLGLLAARLQLLASPGIPLGKGFEMVAIARELAASGNYANPFEVMPTGPTAVNPPLYPLFLAGLLRLFGDIPNFKVSAVVITVLVHGIHFGLLPLVSRQAIGRLAPGVWAAIVGIVLPVVPLMPQWDAVYTAAGLMILCACSARFPERMDNWRPVLSGTLLGLLILLNPLAGIVGAAWIVVFLGRKHVLQIRFLRFLGVAALTAGVVFVPWALRNWRTLGSPVLRTNLGMTLYASNNSCAHSSMAITHASGCFDVYHPNGSLAESLKLVSMGEVAYDRFRTESTLGWIKQNPDRFVQLTARRVFEFWFPDTLKEPVSAYGVWICTALSIPGLALLWKRQALMARFVLATFCLFPVPYYIVVSDLRYRVPILWMTLLCAGYVAAELSSRVFKLWKPTSSLGDHPKLANDD